MSRPSAREEILDAALRIGSEQGLHALTFENLADASGKTKGGILYHFGTRDDLIEAALDKLMQIWHDDALRLLEAPFEKASREDRIVAFMLSATEPGSALDGAADLSIVADVMREERYVHKWNDLRDRWVGDVSTLTRRQQIALAAADGTWIDEAMQNPPYAPGQRDALLADLVALVRE